VTENSSVSLAEDFLGRPRNGRDDISEVCKCEIVTSRSLSFSVVVCVVGDI
jgi:hypothetical protein